MSVKSSSVRTPHSLKKRERRNSLLVSGAGTPSAAATAAALDERFFGFHPLAFIDDITNAANDYAYDGADYVERKLRAPGALRRVNEELEAELGAGADQLLEKLQHALDVNLDRFELYALQQLFKVPNALANSTADALLAAHDGAASDAEPSRSSRSGQSGRARQDADADADAETERRLDVELDRLSAAADRQRQANAFMRAAATRAETFAEQLEPLLSDVEPLLSDAKTAPIDSTLRSVVQRLGALHAAHNDAKRRVDALDNNNNNATTKAKSALTLTTKTPTTTHKRDSSSVAAGGLSTEQLQKIQKTLEQE